MSYEGKVVIDSLGRNIVLRKPDILARYYLFRAMGEDSKNPSLVDMMVPLLFVKSIDGAPLENRMNTAECVADLKKLGSEGSIAVAEAISAEMRIEEKEATENIKK